MPEIILNHIDQKIKYQNRSPCKNQEICNLEPAEVLATV